MKRASVCLPRSRSCVHLPTSSDTQPNTNAHTFTHSLTHTHTHSLSHSHTHTFTHTFTHPLTHSFSLYFMGRTDREETLGSGVKAVIVSSVILCACEYGLRAAPGRQDSLLAIQVWSTTMAGLVACVVLGVGAMLCATLCLIARVLEATFGSLPWVLAVWRGFTRCTWAIATAVLLFNTTAGYALCLLVLLLSVASLPTSAATLLRYGPCLLF